MEYELYILSKKVLKKDRPISMFYNFSDFLHMVVL